MFSKDQQCQQWFKQKSLYSMSHWVMLQNKYCFYVLINSFTLILNYPLPILFFYPLLHCEAPSCSSLHCFIQMEQSWCSLSSFFHLLSLLLITFIPCYCQQRWHVQNIQSQSWQSGGKGETRSRGSPKNISNRMEVRMSYSGLNTQEGISPCAVQNRSRVPLAEAPTAL